MAEYRLILHATSLNPDIIKQTGINERGDLGRNTSIYVDN